MTQKASQEGSKDFSPSPANPPLHFCPRCGRSGLARPNPKRAQCPTCDFHLYLNVAAAVVALIEDGGKLLVTARKYDPWAGTWDFPGGFVDPGETGEEALRREIHEELHLKINAARYFCSMPNRYPYGGVEYRTLDIAYICRVEDMSTLKAGDDVADCFWVPPRQLRIRRFGLEGIRKLAGKYRDHVLA